MGGVTFEDLVEESKKRGVKISRFIADPDLFMLVFPTGIFGNDTKFTSMDKELLLEVIKERCPLLESETHAQT